MAHVPDPCREQPTVSQEDDLKTITAQESALHFDQFGAETAWTIGSRLRRQAVDLKPPMLFEIQIAGRVLFTAATEGVTSSQADWIRRKRNTVMWFGRSTYAIGLKMQLAGQTLATRYGMSLSDYATDGGGFPITLRGTGVIGSIIASGLTQHEDHNLVVATLAETLAITIPMLNPKA